MEQSKVIPQPQQDAIETAGHFYGLVIPEEDLKRRRPVQDFKAGAEWQYRRLATEMEAMRKALEWYADPGNYTYDPDGELISTAYNDNKVGDKAKNVLVKYPSPINNTPDGK